MMKINERDLVIAFYLFFSLRDALNKIIIVIF